MLIQLRPRWDDARLALIMSVADLYFKPDLDQDEEILRELSEQYPEEGEAIMELMPGWKRWDLKKEKPKEKPKGKRRARRK
ncbi:hypothetical protein J7E73_13660 [Paenibacillus albidus]|uniref:hypothetical protein n=1 Tax=Paenibacillus albidus TaxID=2041023 RepID=UPI001BE8A68B|nr:hypothetical protein [Paenibacillus albidus]MBT2290170.1 hypothetical protein [Paenibacillus albidus]